jgi:spore maturation protein CgeB
VPPAEVVKYYNGAKIVLNIHREYNCRYLNRNSRKLKTYSPNNRVFDISACGAFQIISVRRDLEKYLKSGKECIVAKNSNDIINYCEHYLKHQQEREQIANNAYNKVMSEHKMSDRIKKIVGLLGV